MQFPLLDWAMNDTLRYELNPPHLINVAIPCASRNNGKYNITVGYYQKKIASNVLYSFIEMDL